MSNDSTNTVHIHVIVEIWQLNPINFRYFNSWNYKVLRCSNFCIKVLYLNHQRYQVNYIVEIGIEMKYFKFNR